MSPGTEIPWTPMHGPPMGNPWVKFGSKKALFLHFLRSIKFINLHLVWCFHVVYIFRLLCLMMTFHSRKRLLKYCDSLTLTTKAVSTAVKRHHIFDQISVF